MNTNSWVVVGLDNGGTCNSATVLDDSRRFLVDRLVESPSRVREGPNVAIEALVGSLDQVLGLTGVTRGSVRAVGLGTPGPASPDGVISSKGATNFADAPWRGFDIRSGLERRLGVPVIYNNDGNAAALYAHHAHFGHEAALNSSVSAIVGTGLGGGVIEAGRVVRGAAGMAGELGHVHIPMQGLLADGQPIPQCNCGFVGDVESVASPNWDREEPPAVLADALSGPRAREKGVDQRGREAGPELRGLRRPAGTRDLQPAGDGDRAALYDCEQLHRSKRLLRRRRRRRGFT